MNFAMIRNNVCVNTIACQNEYMASALEVVMRKDGLVDKIVPLQPHYGIGDLYQDDVWEKRPQDINMAKIVLIDKSKYLLEEYLRENPLTFIDSKQYSVTAEKQTLLVNAIQLYEMKLQSGLSPILKWNSTGKECTEWTIENLILLAITIANYVEPLVSKQQSIETQIKACTTVEELDLIVINYETV